LPGPAQDFRRMTFSPDGKKLLCASAEGTLKGWDISTGRETLAIVGDTHYFGTFSADGNRIVSGEGKFGAPGQVKVWDASSGQESQALEGHKDSITSLAVRGDGKWIVSASQDMTVKVWPLPGIVSSRLRPE